MNEFIDINQINGKMTNIEGYLLGILSLNSTLLNAIHQRAYTYNIVHK